MGKKIISLLIIILGTIAIVTISYTIYKENKRTRQIDLEIEKLKTEAEKIRQSNESLRDKIAYLETSNFEEIIAKEKMNLQKPDEKVVIVKPSLSKEDSVPLPETKEEAITEEPANYIKWWNQFFKY